MSRSRKTKILISLFFLALGIGLFFFILKNDDFKGTVGILKTADPLWITIVFIVSIICHILRALRWHLLIKANGSNPSKVYTYHSMMFGYFVNVLAPRVGEFTRCAALRKKNKVSFNITFGTVLMDKILDSIILIIIIAIVFLSQFEATKQIFTEDIPTLAGAEKGSGHGKYYILGGLALLYILYQVFKKKLGRTETRINAFARQVLRGAVSIKAVNQKSLLVLYTVVIWICYFLMTYLCFFCFEGSKEFGFWIAFSLLAFGGVARAIPIPAGSMGAYHLIITAAIIQFTGMSIDDENSVQLSFALATVIHGIQLLFYLGFGGISSVIIWRNKVTQ